MKFNRSMFCRTRFGPFKVSVTSPPHTNVKPSLGAFTPKLNLKSVKKSSPSPGSVANRNPEGGRQSLAKKFVQGRSLKLLTADLLSLSILMGMLSGKCSLRRFRSFGDDGDYGFF